MAIITETYTKDRQLSPHFALHEFLCKDGSKTVKWSEETVALLEEIFKRCSKISKAIIISGYRTPDYSAKPEVGGTKDDGHTVGIAVDVKWYDKNNNLISPKYIACVAQDIGFTGIGLMRNSIHLDTRTTENYKNGKWWGDETKEYSLSANGKDFYNYCGLRREEVDKILGRTSKIETKPTTEEVKVEQPQPSIEVLSPNISEPKIEPEEVVEAVTKESEENTKDSHSSILEALRTLLKLILEWVKGK